MRVLAEFNRCDYPGREDAWRPEAQVRFGVDYFRQSRYTAGRPWYDLYFQIAWRSSNEFDPDYNAILFGVAIRGSPIVRYSLSPYFAIESGLSGRGSYS